MPFVIRSRIKRPAPAPVPTSDPTLVITEIIQPAAPVVVPESVVVPTTAAPEPVVDQALVDARRQFYANLIAKREALRTPAPTTAAPEPVADQAPAPTTVAPEPVADQTPASVSVFSHPSLDVKKQKFLEFLAKRR